MTNDGWYWVRTSHGDWEVWRWHGGVWMDGPRVRIEAEPVQVGPEVTAPSREIKGGEVTGPSWEIKGGELGSAYLDLLATRGTVEPPEDRITLDELRAMFGQAMPVEAAAALLAGNMALPALREKLQALADGMRPDTPRTPYYLDGNAE